MVGLTPIAMSQTKEDLLKHLNLPPETYALMAKETDVIYNWLISHKSHLKENGKRKAPYDWSDIQERAKDDAMGMIAQGGDQFTDYYWNLGVAEDNNPNWVAKWFLYHKFRYRDGRNRTQRSGEKHHDKHGSSKHKHASREQPFEYIYDYDGMTAAGVYFRLSRTAIVPPLGVDWSSGQGYSPPEASTSTGQYETTEYNYHVADSTETNTNKSGTYYDPVRDV
ncbi:hypothetical protein IFR05_007963 [Cadophora sp. M221]|nr:hypothetical protein IFR05_007963 [Cadophora sp. M221]